MITKATNEPEDDRFARLASEYEIQGEFEEAKKYFDKRVEVNDRSISLWKDYALFSLRNGNDQDKAEEHLQKTISLCKEDDYELFLNIGALLVQKKKSNEALIFLKKVGKHEDNPDFYIKAHLLMSILYGEDGDEDLKEKHFNFAMRMKLRQPIEEKEVEEEEEDSDEEEKKEGEGEEPAENEEEKKVEEEKPEGPALNPKKLQKESEPKAIVCEKLETDPEFSEL